MTVTIDNLQIANNKPFVLLAGPCVVEEHEMTLATAKEIKRITEKLGIPYVFKASVKKANRTSVSSFTGLDKETAYGTLSAIRNELELPLITDVHTVEDVEEAAKVVQFLQIPAFLSRQTDLLLAAGKSGCAVNIKKGQFMAPDDMQHAAAKVASTGNNKVMLTERGTTFGYHNLVVDMRGLAIMAETGYPVIMDATHAVQIPSKGSTSGGEPAYIPLLARAALSVGVAGLFMEVHPDPPKALSDAGSQFPLKDLERLLTELKQIDDLRKSFINAENNQ